MSELPTTRPLSFRAAAEALNHAEDPTGRKLKAMVLQREKELGTTIATRLAGKKQPKMRVTLAVLFKCFPEFKPHRTNDELERSVRGYLSAIDERVTSVASAVAAKEVRDVVMPQIRDDRARITKLEEQMRDRCRQETRTLELVEGLSMATAGAVGARRVG